MPFAITTPKQALGSSSKISFFNNESHFMPFLSALDRNTYFSHKFFTVISNAIVYERDFSRKTNNLYLFFCDVCIFVLVGIANIIDTQILQNGAAIRTAVVFFYLANEGLSCLENAAVHKVFWEE